MSRRSLRRSHAAWLVLGLLAAAFPTPAQFDDPCGDLVFPSDCVQQLGEIGSSPLGQAAEGFLNIAAPVVDPMLILRSSNVGNGNLYVLNPLANLVRVLDPDMSPVRDIRVCYRPSALAQSSSGSELLVACHASHAVWVIDTATNQVVADIQDRDARGRPRLQEPMAMVARGGTLYVASSQNNSIAVVDLATREVLRYIDLPGQDPRSLALTPGGKHLVVGNFLSGNRTEPDHVLNGAIFNPQTPSGAVCQALFDADPEAIDVIDESSPRFMDTTHPDYAVLAECYFLAQAFGETTQVVKNPRRSDHDVVVVDLDTEEVVFSSDQLGLDDLGTINYHLTLSDDGTKVYLATVEARNQIGPIDKRPLVNQLVVLDLDPATGSLALNARIDLDAPYLDDQDEGLSLAATPAAVATAGGQLLVAAAGSDRLLVLNGDGSVAAEVPVGFTPKGVVVDGDTAWVYNSTGLTVSEVDLGTNTETGVRSIGDNALPQLQRAGAHLFNSAQFAANGTFSCASCHPDGHTDGLTWILNEVDTERTTMTLQEIDETAPYHWDGAKCNLVQIIQDGIADVFRNPGGTDTCQTEAMVEFINGMVRPHTPFRAADDSLSDEARLGLAVMTRARFMSLDDIPQGCTFSAADPVTERHYLAAIGDPGNEIFTFNAGGGPFPSTLVAETCSTANCHATPNLNSEGTFGGMTAVSPLGVWDRIQTTHDGFTTRHDYMVAQAANREFHGAEPVRTTDSVTGELAMHGFADAFFRHTEYNFDNRPETHGFHLTDAITQAMMEEDARQSSAVGMTVVFDGDDGDEQRVARLRGFLEDAANQAKIVLRGTGSVGGAPTFLTWNPADREFEASGGGRLTMDGLMQAMGPGDLMALYGVLPPDQGDAIPPRLKVVSRDTSPVLCSEGYPVYRASLATGETDVPLILHGIDVEPGSAILINGQVTGEPLTGGGPTFVWTLPAVPVEGGIVQLQVMSPTGMLSNSLVVPTTAPVVPAFEPNDVAASGSIALSWTDQFQLTGPGTRYDVFSGSLTDLRTSGFAAGSCAGNLPLARPNFGEGVTPAPGEAVYYVVRAQNQLGVTTWGSPTRDAQIAASSAPCADLFP